jgi:hypothetical protein
MSDVRRTGLVTVPRAFKSPRPLLTDSACCPFGPSKSCGQRPCLNVVSAPSNGQQHILKLRQAFFSRRRHAILQALCLLLVDYSLRFSDFASHTCYQHKFFEPDWADHGRWSHRPERFTPYAQVFHPFVTCRTAPCKWLVSGHRFTPTSSSLSILFSHTFPRPPQSL